MLGLSCHQFMPDQKTFCHCHCVTNSQSQTVTHILQTKPFGLSRFPAAHGTKGSHAGDSPIGNGVLAVLKVLQNLQRFVLYPPGAVQSLGGNGATLSATDMLL